jgi:hypothetical protein
MTQEIMDKMTDKEFDDYLKERAKDKPYLDRYVKEGGYNLKDLSDGVSYEEWLKREKRDEKLKELGL